MLAIKTEYLVNSDKEALNKLWFGDHYNMRQIWEGSLFSQREAVKVCYHCGVDLLAISSV